MAIVLIDKGMEIHFPEAVKKTIALIKPYFIKSVNDHIKSYHFDSNEYGANEIVIARLYKSRTNYSIKIQENVIERKESESISYDY